MSVSVRVSLCNEINFKRTPSIKKFQTWVNAVVDTIPEKIPKTCTEICISIVDSEISAQLNQTYRHKNGPTNVLSFTYESPPGIAKTSLGDLAICAEIVESESLAQNKNTIAHWAHLTIHGMLHLLEYDHITEKDAIIMEPLEIKILQKLGFNNPYE